MKRTTALALATLILGLVAVPVSAGGSWLSTTKDAYEPGDEVEAVGYVGAPLADGEEPLVAMLLLVPVDEHREGMPRIPRVEVGPITVESTGLGGYLGSRVHLRFTLPTDLEPGDYLVDVTRHDGSYYGDLIGAGVRVGLEPYEEHYRFEWAFDEPLIAGLPDDAYIVGPFDSVSVREIRAGRYPSGSEAYLMDPSVLDRPGVVIVPPTTTTTHALDDPALVPAAGPVPTTTLANQVPPPPTASPTTATTLDLAAAEPVTEPSMDLTWTAVALVSLWVCLVWALGQPSRRVEPAEEAQPEGALR